MSDQYYYRCKKCGNTVITDDAGCECVSRAISFLYHCRDCGMLAQLWESIHYCVRPMDKHTVGTARQRANPHWYLADEGNTCSYNGTCPKCGSNNIHTWNPVDDFCPKCGGKMQCDGSRPIIHTD